MVKHGRHAGKQTADGNEDQGGGHVRQGGLDVGVAAVGGSHQLGAVVEGQKADVPHDGEPQAVDQDQHDGVGRGLDPTAGVQLVHGHPEVAEQLAGHGGKHQRHNDGLAGSLPLLLPQPGQSAQEDVAVKDDGGDRRHLARRRS